MPMDLLDRVMIVKLLPYGIEHMAQVRLVSALCLKAAAAGDGAGPSP